MLAANGILFNHESPIARRNLRHPQDHARRRRDPARAAGHALSRQSRRQARLGPCARLCRRHVADPAAQRSRRFRAGDRRDALGARIRRTGLCRDRHGPFAGKARASTRSVSMPASGAVLVRDRSALFPADRGRHAARRRRPRRERELGWSHTTGFRELVAEMVQADLARAADEHRPQRPLGMRQASDVTFELRGQAGLRRRASRHGRLGHRAPAGGARIARS